MQKYRSVRILKRVTVDMWYNCRYNSWFYHRLVPHIFSRLIINQIADATMLTQDIFWPRTQSRPSDTFSSGSPYFHYHTCTVSMSPHPASLGTQKSVRRGATLFEPPKSRIDPHLQSSSGSCRNAYRLERPEGSSGINGLITQNHGERNYLGQRAFLVDRKLRTIACVTWKRL